MYHLPTSNTPKYPCCILNSPSASQNIPPPSLSFQPTSIYLDSSQPLQSKNQTITTPLQPSNITIVPLIHKDFIYPGGGLTPEQQKQLDTNPPLLLCPW